MVRLTVFVALFESSVIRETFFHARVSLANDNILLVAFKFPPVIDIRIKTFIIYLFS
jgi:hypothetical protein